MGTHVGTHSHPEKSLLFLPSVAMAVEYVNVYPCSRGINVAQSNVGGSLPLGGE